MKAIEILKQYVKEDMIDKVGVIAILQDKKKMTWHHVHNNEDVPTEGYDIAIHIKIKVI